MRLGYFQLFTSTMPTGWYLSDLAERASWTFVLPRGSSQVRQTWMINSDLTTIMGQWNHHEQVIMKQGQYQPGNESSLTLPAVRLPL